MKDFFNNSHVWLWDVGVERRNPWILLSASVCCDVQIPAADRLWHISTLGKTFAAYNCLFLIIKTHFIWIYIIYNEKWARWCQLSCMNTCAGVCASCFPSAAVCVCWSEAVPSGPAVGNSGCGQMDSKMMMMYTSETSISLCLFNITY